jgi:hypothetical protein
VYQYPYPTGSYVAAVYQGEWFVGQVLDKTNEPKALPADDYVFINFMQRVSKDKDLFKWPDKADKLNTLREDVLFECGAPVPSKDTSTTRSITYSLSTHEIKRANHLLNKAYYHIKFIYQALPVLRGHRMSTGGGCSGLGGWLSQATIRKGYLLMFTFCKHGFFKRNRLKFEKNLGLAFWARMM